MNADRGEGVRSVAVRGAGALRELMTQGAARVRSLSPIASATRRELGLPEDCVVVMSGHQADVWHAGILAKWLAGRRIVERLRERGTPAVFAWVVVDQDVNDPTRIAYPASAAAGVRRGLWRWEAGEDAPREDVARVPTGCRGSTRVGPAPTDGASEGVRSGLTRMREALASSHGLTLAERVTDATLGLLRACGCEAQGADATRVFMATALARTAGMAWLAEQMGTLDGARASAEAYNRAAGAFPSAGMTPMAIGVDRVEVPLWRVRMHAAREREVIGARAARAGAGAGGVLAPRALAMTAALRLFACEAFIHGLGGEAYDPVMERWIDAWLGERARAVAGVAMAPTLTATTTVTLRWDKDERTPTLAEIARASWRAHAGRHGAVGDLQVAAHKRMLAQKIAALPRNGAERIEAYRAMHAWLDGVRGEHAAEIAGLASRANELAMLRGEAQVREERAWAFALHEPKDLAVLRERIEREVDLLLEG